MIFSQQNNIISDGYAVKSLRVLLLFFSLVKKDNLSITFVIAFSLALAFSLLTLNSNSSKTTKYVVEVILLEDQTNIL